jgi:hypothetical protein
MTGMLWGLLVMRPPSGGVVLYGPAYETARELTYRHASPDIDEDFGGLAGALRSYNANSYGPPVSAFFAPPGV